jgi:hypothetical protein
MEPSLYGDPSSKPHSLRLYGYAVYLHQWLMAADLGPAARHIYRMSCILRKVPITLFSKDPWEQVREESEIPLDTFQRAWKRLQAAGLIDDGGAAVSGKPEGSSGRVLRRVLAKAHRTATAPRRSVA